MYLTKKLPLFTKATSVYENTPENADIKAAFTAVDNFGEEYLLYREDDQYIYVPRNLAPAGKDLNPKHPAVDFTLQNFTPRNSRQERIISRLQDLIPKGDSFILEAGTGVGKTVMAMVAIAIAKKRVLIVVDQENIKNQWYKAIETFLGIPRENVGLIQGDKCNVEPPICICMVQSISKIGRYPDHVYDAFEFLIADEVHIMGADQFSKGAGVFNTRQRLGLSATVDRSDGRELVFKGHIGQTKISSQGVPLRPKVIRVQSAYKLPVRVKKLSDGTTKLVQVPHSPGKLGSILGHLTQDEGRNRMMANFMKQAYDAGRNVVFFSDYREKHLDPMAKVLISMGVDAKDIGYYVGGMKEKALDEAAAKRIVLTTYKMTAKAVDKPWWDTAVMGTPRSDIRQIVGRILREYEGKKNFGEDKPGTFPLVFDVVDGDSWVLANYAKGRDKYYQQVKAEVVNVG